MPATALQKPVSTRFTRFGMEHVVARALAQVLVVLVMPACGATCGSTPRTPVDAGASRMFVCPGDEGCASTAQAPVRAGVAVRSVLPTRWEMPNPRYLQLQGCDEEQTRRVGTPRCGSFPTVLQDCGLDGLCPGDPGYPGRDVDGTEGDGAESFFLDCGGDRLCPDNVPEEDDALTPGVDESRDGVDNDADGAVDADDHAYTAPDEDGTEGDNAFLAAWIAGFGNNRPALGTHGRVDARCIALNTAETTVVLCSVDAVGLFHSEVERVRAELRARHADVAVDQLHVMGSHTHESVDTLGQWGRADPVPALTGLLQGHNAHVVRQLADAAAEAVRGMRPVELRTWRTSTGREGFLHDGRSPFIFDDAFTAVEARMLDGTPIFTLLNWSNHPEVLGGDLNLMSADLVHGLRENVERGLEAVGTHPARGGRGGTAVFFNGTVGGLMAPLHVDFTARDGTPRPDSMRTFARLEDYAELLADQILEAMEDPPAHVFSEGVLRVSSLPVRIRVENTLLLTAFRAGLFDREAFDVDRGTPLSPSEILPGRRVEVASEVFALNLGPVSILAAPGELFPETAVGVRAEQSLGMEQVGGCPPVETCPSGPRCPPAEPPGGYLDCACEACRTCRPVDLAAAREAPLKQRMPGGVPMIFGLADDELGYLVPAWQWQVSRVAPYVCQALDHYEESNSAGPDTLGTLMGAWDRVLLATEPPP